MEMDEDQEKEKGEKREKEKKHQFLTQDKRENSCERNGDQLTDTSHQDTSLSVEIGVDLLLESRLVRVTGSDSNGESSDLLLGLIECNCSSVAWSVQVASE